MIAIVNLFHVVNIADFLITFLTAVHELQDQVPIWAVHVFVTKIQCDVQPWAWTTHSYCSVYTVSQKKTSGHF